MNHPRMHLEFSGIGVPNEGARWSWSPTLTAQQTHGARPISLDRRGDHVPHRIVWVPQNIWWPLSLFSYIGQKILWGGLGLELARVPSQQIDSNNCGHWKLEMEKSTWWWDVDGMRMFWENSKHFPVTRLTTHPPHDKVALDDIFLFK